MTSNRCACAPVIKGERILRGMVDTGIKGTKSVKVDDGNTAEALGSGTLAVFATPAMIALIEATASESVAPYLDEGSSTVGTHLDITHEAPTPIGMTVTVEAEIRDVSENGKMVVFNVRAWDEKGPISSGIHTRAIINNEKFLSKCNAKLEG